MSVRYPVVFQVKPKPPYMVTPHLASFTLPSKPTPCLYENGCCRRAFKNLVYEVCVEGEPHNPVLNVRVYRGNSEDARRLVEHVYNVGLDYNEFLERCREYERLYETAKKHLGLRPALSPSLFESLVKTIVSQQIPQRMALNITSRLVEALGEKVVVENKVFHDFPEHSKLARASIEELRRLGLSRRKAEYVKNIAEAVLEGYDLESLTSMSPEEAVQELTRFKGVGPWTAKLAIMASTGNLSFELLEDTAVMGGLKRLGLDEQSVKRISARLGRYLGLIMYLSALEYESSKKTRGGRR